MHTPLRHEVRRISHNTHMEWMRPTVSNFRLQIELALVPRQVHVGLRLTRTPGHGRTTNAFAGGCRISAGRGSLADQVATGIGHYRPVRTVSSPSARDLCKRQYNKQSYTHILSTIQSHDRLIIFFSLSYDPFLASIIYKREMFFFTTCCTFCYRSHTRVIAKRHVIELISRRDNGAIVGRLL